ncbi:MAG: hypothetical protein C7B43_20400 [Sulfobacillus benefaciens]|uniref:Uncharacterized protein n=1 Tax=Sulfobacillus benefaciens TaxID=453960 RepID=A0A2T2WL93_9FIRM|nr:MAG: hypothetical protein C7B43_20400 [Sulfobacillus benefaciens]HBQ94568.1 hypothetical protein [Sulfobacillus sp.]
MVFVGIGAWRSLRVHESLQGFTARIGRAERRMGDCRKTEQRLIHLHAPKMEAHNGIQLNQHDDG